MSRTASVGFVARTGRPMATSQDFVNWVCGDDLDPEFLMLLLLRSRAYIRSLSAGAIHKTVYYPTVKDFHVCIPPIDEQRQIASNLRKHLGAASQIASRSSDRRRSAHDLRQRSIDDAVEGSWPLVPVGDLASIQSGYAFESAWFRPSGMRLLRNMNVHHGRIDWSDTVNLDPAREHLFDRFRLDVGDVVLSLDRPLVGGGIKVARIGKVDVPSLLLQRVARFSPGPLLDNDFLYAFLRSTRFSQAIGGHEQSLGVPHVSPRQVASIEMPAAPVRQQREIAAGLRERLARIDQIADGVDTQRRAVEALPMALLRRAFSAAMPNKLAHGVNDLSSDG